MFIIKNIIFLAIALTVLSLANTASAGRYTICRGLEGRPIPCRPVVAPRPPTPDPEKENQTYVVAALRAVFSEEMKTYGAGLATRLSDIAGAPYQRALAIMRDLRKNNSQANATDLESYVRKVKRDLEAPAASSANVGPVYLDLTIRYDAPYSAIDSISTIELRPHQGGGDTSYEALAYAADDQTLKAYFKPSRGDVPGGVSYDVLIAGSIIGSINLSKLSGEVSMTLQTLTP